MNDFTDVSRSLKDQLEDLSNLQAASFQSQDIGTNLVYGGPYETRLTNHGWVQGPERANLDSTHSWTFYILVPDWVRKLLRCSVYLAPKAYQSSIASLAAEATHTHAITTPTGQDNSASAAPASGTVSVATSEHVHEWATFDTSEAAGGTSRRWIPGNGAAVTFWFPSSSTADLNTDIPSAVTNVAGPSHQHLLGNHSHSITTPTAGGSSHNHAITQGVSPGTSAAGIHIWVDGVDVTTALGGPWDANAVVSILPYLLSAQGLPVTGLHTIELTSTQVGAIEMMLDWYVVSKPAS